MSAIKSKKSRLREGEDRANDIIEVALRSGTFTDEELVDQLMTFLAAGHETTASALTWVIYLLCKYPTVQSTLREEVFLHDRDQSSPQGSPTTTTVDSLPYLQAVINEALRLFPPVAVTIRVSVRDTVIAGEHIPKGTTIMIPPWAVNCSVQTWGEDALEFVPERWINERKKQEGFGNFSSITFLHGPRSCIGERFARAELACLTAAWVTKFETNLQDEDFVPEIRGGITAKPKNGLHVDVKPID